MSIVANKDFRTMSDADLRIVAARHEELAEHHCEMADKVRDELNSRKAVRFANDLQRLFVSLKTER